jgi:two-component system OmpR family sensor kinase
VNRLHPVNWLRPVASRLALRFYLVGLLQMAVVVAGFITLMILHRPKQEFRIEQQQYANSRIAQALAEPGRLEGELLQLGRIFRADITVREAGSGQLIARSYAGPTRRCTSDNSHYCSSMALSTPDGRHIDIEFSSLGLPHPPATFALRVLGLVLLVVGITSWLLARGVLRPLEKLATAARAFGSGDATARASLTRSDELGKVGHVFDEMADRVGELLRAEREMLANVSHELRTPLARIRVAVDLAAEGDAEVAKETLVDVVDDLDELDTLISDVLATARLSLASPESPLGLALHRQKVSAQELLERAESRFHSQFPTRRLVVEPGSELPLVDGDPTLLRRLLDNLLQNAHRYSESADSPVILRARSEGGLVFEVQDCGVGISEEDLAQVFQPFFRADRSRTRATGGLGLGLTLAQRIVDAHEGRIELSSELGRGTLAKVWLPAESTESAQH